MVSDNKSKRINVRLETLTDADLVKRAAAKCGLTVAEWSRRALIKVAEEQIHSGGVTMNMLKNVLLTRRILELAQVVPENTLHLAMGWARAQAKDAVEFNQQKHEQDDVD